MGRGREGDFEKTPSGWAPRGSCQGPPLRLRTRGPWTRKRPHWSEARSSRQPQRQDRHTPVLGAGPPDSRSGCWQGSFVWPLERDLALPLAWPGLVDWGTCELHPVGEREKDQRPVMNKFTNAHACLVGRWSRVLLRPRAPAAAPIYPAGECAVSRRKACP